MFPALGISHENWGNMFHVNTAVTGRGQGSISCVRVTLPLTIKLYTLSVNPETSMSQEHEYHEWQPSPVSSHSPNPKIIAAQDDHSDSPKTGLCLSTAGSCPEKLLKEVTYSNFT